MTILNAKGGKGILDKAGKMTIKTEAIPCKKLQEMASFIFGGTGVKSFGRPVPCPIHATTSTTDE